MKYAIVFAIIVAVFSFAQCYGYLAMEQKVGFLKVVYCNISFFRLLPRSFSFFDFFVHLFVWIVISIGLYRVYLWYLGGKFP
jgi:hypothetical protein